VVVPRWIFLGGIAFVVVAVVADSLDAVDSWMVYRLVVGLRVPYYRYYYYSRPPPR
jgi:hypothetical protein